MKKMYRYICFYVFVLFVMWNFVSADVIISQPLWWNHVSADFASDALLPSWKAIGNIVITEPVSWYWDLDGPQIDATLVLSAPTSREFKAWVGTVSFTAGRNITNASILVTNRTATITFSTDYRNKRDVLTIGWLKVRPISGKFPPKTEYIMRSSLDPWTASIYGIYNDVTQFAKLAMDVGVVKYLVITLAWQTFQNGVGPVGFPNAQLSGISFIIPSVTTTDQFFSLQASHTWDKILTWSGPLWKNIYTTTIKFAWWISITPIAATIKMAQTTTLTVKQWSYYAYTSVPFIVNNPIIAIWSPSAITLPPVTTSTTVQTVVSIPSVWDYFYVNDQKWFDAWYYTTISCSSPTSSGNTISNNNIFVSSNSAITLLSGTTNPRVISSLLASYVPCNTTLSFIRRNSWNNSGVTWKYGQLLNFKMNVPAWQAPGDYQGVITFTLIEN